MTAAVVIVALAQVLVVAFLTWERAQERRHPSPNLEALIALTDRLCQRLQAPHAAIIEHDENVRGRTEEYAPPAVMPEDDDDFWASKDKLAEQLMEAEVNGSN